MTFAQWEALPESEREWWLHRHRARLAEHACGHPREVCRDPDREWYPQLEVCYPTREQQAAWAAFERLHSERPWHNGDMTSWAAERSAEHPFRWDHGVTVWVAATDHGHGGAFTTRENPQTED